MSRTTQEPRIQLLDSHVINKIAAGEVVERPASVVKELVENALDAKATFIEVMIKNGGRSLIRVTDNGGGMSSEELQLAVQRHATSKIKEVDDLYALESFGFRGEALPSIASVSKFKICSRWTEQDTGYEIVLNKGEVQKARETARAIGTTVDVEELFYNTPARRKFLKTDTTERAQITDAIIYSALSNPAVGFKLIDGMDVKIDCPKAKTRMERIGQLYGKSYCDELVEVQVAHNSNAYQLEAYVGKPTLARANRVGQLLFVNRRPVKSQSLQFAIQLAYEGLLDRGKFAVAFLFLTIDPNQIDVNVHPSKREIKIENERHVQSFIRQTVQEALIQANLFPTVPSSGFQQPGQTNTVNEPHATYSRSGVGQKDLSLDFVRRVYDQKHEDTAAGETERPNDPRRFRILGRAKKTYIFGEDDQGVFVIDQHAAHERIMFEQVYETISKESIPTQHLMTPIQLEFTPKEVDSLTEQAPILLHFGLAIRHFGGNTILIETMPEYLNKVNIQEVLRDFVAEMVDNYNSDQLEDLKRDFAAMIACKKRSVKANDPLSQGEMEGLVEALYHTKSPFTCPHGRPTLIRLTLSEIEKRFHRK